MPTIKTERLNIEPSHKNCWSIYDQLDAQLIGKLFFRNQWFNIILKPQSLRLGVATEASYGLMKAINCESYKAKSNVPHAQQFLLQMGFEQHDNHYEVTVEKLIRPARYQVLNEKLGIDTNALLTPVHRTSAQLVDSGLDCFGRPSKLHPEANRAWQKMQDQALKDGVTLELVSAFRSMTYQANLIYKKLSNGQQIDDILTTNAAPGHSEHHTGCAVDISTTGFEPLATEFENSEAFTWLTEHAHQFGFIMSFPKGNDHGIIYEPWHWCFKHHEK
ncbi:MAG: M15 family metallopeptidase [Marinicella sp.]